MSEIRILVTGSRDWTDAETLDEVLHQEHDALVESDPDRYIREGITIVTGACRTGADKMAEDWGDHQFGVEVETHPADWKANKRAAGFIRNHEMVDLGADVCVAFLNPCSKQGCPDRERHPGLPHYSHGASDCSTYAARKGIRVRSVIP